MCFNLFSAVLLGIICLVLIWSCAGVDLAVVIVSYHTWTMTCPCFSGHRFISIYCNSLVNVSTVCYLNIHNIFFSSFDKVFQYWECSRALVSIIIVTGDKHTCTYIVASPLHASFCFVNPVWLQNFQSWLLCPWVKKTSIREGAFPRMAIQDLNPTCVNH